MKGRTVREMKEELSDQGNEGRMRRTTVRMGLYRLRGFLRVSSYSLATFVPAPYRSPLVHYRRPAEPGP